MASFGGADFGSVLVKREDLKARLKRDAEQMRKEAEKEKEEEAPQAKRPRTRCVGG